MRLTTVLLIASLMQVSASTLAQNITLKSDKESLEGIFSKIKKQTGYNVLYRPSGIYKVKNISVDLKNIPLQLAMEKILINYDLKFEIDDNTIVISAKTPQVSTADPNSSVSSPELLKQSFVGVLLEGIVRSEEGGLLTNTSVRIKGGRFQTQTNNQGFFSVRDIDERATLQISMIGFETLEIGIRKSQAGYTAYAVNKEQENQLKITPGSTIFLEIRLKVAVNRLDEMVIQAYGTTSRRFNTGSITTVTAKDIEKQPVMNPLMALRGLVPGLVATPNSGYASGPVKVEIRGRNNINPRVSSDPLILIDGMPLTLINLDGGDQSNGASIMPDLSRFQVGSLGSPAGGQSPLFGINPMDIESITILKDADATAIYGSRGANGVILIATKKGQAGATRINVNLYQGISKVTRRYPLLNTAQYVQLRKESLRNDGVAMNLEYAPDLVAWDTTRNVDWQKELWGGTGRVTTFNGGLSGTSGNTSFRLNGSYSRQTEILTVSGGNQAANMALNLEHRSNDQKFTTSFSSVFTHSQTDQVNQYGLAGSLAPNTPAMYNENGALNYGPWNEGGLGFAAEFPFGSLLQRSNASTNTVNGNLNFDYKPVKGMDIKTTFGYNNTQLNSKALNPLAAQNPMAYNLSGAALFTNSGSSGWSIEPQINYSGIVGPGQLTALVGSTVQSSFSRYNVARGRDYSSDILLNSIMNAPNQEAYDAYGQYKYTGIFGRISYNLLDRYIVSLNGRRDGSSRFGPGNQFGNFGAIGLAWILSEEKWIKQALPSFINFIKLRGSYGVTGSDGVSDFQYMSQWASGVGNTLIPGYNGITRPLINQHAVNQFFRWQSNKSRNEALELSLLKDGRFNLIIDHYQNRGSNQLLSYPTPVYTGFANVTANWPATVQNSGWEFSLSGNRIIETKDFNWSANFNISFNRNKLQAYPGIQDSPYFTRLTVGQSLNAVYLYHYLGVDPLTGRYSFQDYNNDGILQTNSIGVAPLSPQVDNQVVLDLRPAFTGGFGSQFSYKGINLTLLFDFKSQWGKNAYATSSLPGSRLQNIPVEIYNNHWQKPGDQTTYVKASSSTDMIASSGYFNQSDGVYTDASFIRLTNLSISYNLPDKLTNKLGLKSMNIFMNSQNVFVLTKYKGVDPELQSFNMMPQSKIFTGGISLNF